MDGEKVGCEEEISVTGAGVVGWSEDGRGDDTSLVGGGVGLTSVG